MNTNTVTERELDRLRAYLREWSIWEERYAPRLGAPRVAAFAQDQERGATSASEYMERSDKWAMQIIDTAMDDLIRRQDGMALRAALSARLRNDAVGAKVFRHGALCGLSTAEVDALADRAEREMVLIVKRKGLPLG